MATQGVSLILQHPLFLLENYKGGATSEFSVFAQSLQIINPTPNLALFEFQAIVTSPSGEYTAALGIESLDGGKARQALNACKGGFRNSILSAPGRWSTGGPVTVEPQQVQDFHLGFTNEFTWELRKSSKKRNSVALQVRPYNTDGEWLEFGEARCSLNLAV